MEWEYFPTPAELPCVRSASSLLPIPPPAAAAALEENNEVRRMALCFFRRDEQICYIYPSEESLQYNLPSCAVLGIHHFLFLFRWISSRIMPPFFSRRNGSSRVPSVIVFAGHFCCFSSSSYYVWAPSYMAALLGKWCEARIYTFIQL
jgi:hypothetical protein